MNFWLVFRRGCTFLGWDYLVSSGQSDRIVKKEKERNVWGNSDTVFTATDGGRDVSQDWSRDPKCGQETGEQTT